MPARRASRITPELPAGAAAARTAVAWLARRDLPSEELRRRLYAKGFEAETVAAVVDALGRDGTLNDDRYARNYVIYHAGRGQGPLRIAAELRSRGLPEGLIETALANGPDWEALAARVCRTHFGVQPPTGRAEQGRQARFLQYRGFSADHINAATGADPNWTEAL
jgi:regulatory protein